MNETEQEIEQLYKLLAFTIQELSYFASEDRVNDCLQLPSPTRIITNRAQMAVKRIEDQEPHFFSGYKRYQKRTTQPLITDNSGV